MHAVGMNCHVVIKCTYTVVTFTGGNVTVGSSLTLCCSTRTIGGSITSFTYSFHRGEEILQPQPSSAFYVLTNVQLNHADNTYFCRSYFDGVLETDVSGTSDTGTVSVTSELLCVCCVVHWWCSVYRFKSLLVI